MPHQWALFYFAQSAKNVTDPKRRASVASDLEICSSSSYSCFRIQGQTGNRQPAAAHWLRRARAAVLVHPGPLRYRPNMGCRAGACPSQAVLSRPAGEAALQANWNTITIASGWKSAPLE